MRRKIGFWEKAAVVSLAGVIAVNMAACGKANSKETEESISVIEQSKESSSIELQGSEFHESQDLEKKETERELGAKDAAQENSVAFESKENTGEPTEPTSSTQWEIQQETEGSTYEAEADELINQTQESGGTEEFQEETQVERWWDANEFTEDEYMQKRLKEGYEAYEGYEGSVVAENFKAGGVYTVTGLWMLIEEGETAMGLFRVQDEAGEVAYAPAEWFEDVKEEVAQGGKEEAPSEEVARGSEEAPSQEPQPAPQESQPAPQLSSGTYVGGEDRAYAGGVVYDGIWYASNEDWMAAMGITSGDAYEEGDWIPEESGAYTWE